MLPPRFTIWRGPGNRALLLGAALGGYLFLLIAMLFWHFLLGAPYERASVPLLVGLGLSAALASLLTIWGALASLHWPKRIAGIVVGTALLCGVFVGVFDWPIFYLWQLLVELAVAMFLQIVVLGIAHLWGYRLLRQEIAGPVDASGPAAPVSRLSVRDLFLLITSFAFLSAVMRYLQPPMVPTWIYVLLTIGGCAAGIVGLATTWSALGVGSLVLRGLVLLLVAPLGGIVYLVLEQYYRGLLLYDAWWYAGITLLQTLFMLLPLGITRAHGLRIARPLLGLPQPA